MALVTSALTGLPIVFLSLTYGLVIVYGFTLPPLENDRAEAFFTDDFVDSEGESLLIASAFKDSTSEPV